MNGQFCGFFYWKTYAGLLDAGLEAFYPILPRLYLLIPLVGSGYLYRFVFPGDVLVKQKCTAPPAG